MQAPDFLLTVIEHVEQRLPAVFTPGLGFLGRWPPLFLGFHSQSLECGNLFVREPEGIGHGGVHRLPALLPLAAHFLTPRLRFRPVFLEQGELLFGEDPGQRFVHRFSNLVHPGLRLLAGDDPGPDAFADIVQLWPERLANQLDLLDLGVRKVETLALDSTLPRAGPRPLTAEAAGSLRAIAEASAHFTSPGARLGPQFRLTGHERFDLLRAEDVLQLRSGVPQRTGLPSLPAVLLQDRPDRFDLIVGQAQSIGEVTEDDREIGLGLGGRRALIQRVGRVRWRAVAGDREPCEDDDQAGNDGAPAADPTHFPRAKTHSPPPWCTRPGAPVDSMVAATSLLPRLDLRRWSPRPHSIFHGRAGPLTRL
jgi:hypothetical protein